MLETRTFCGTKIPIKAKRTPRGALQLKVPRSFLTNPTIICWGIRVNTTSVIAPW
jgi:hypothetical protein